MSVCSAGSTLSYVSDNSTVDSLYRLPDAIRTSSISTNLTTLDTSLSSSRADLCAQERGEAEPPSDNGTIDSHYRLPDTLTSSSVSTNPSTLGPPLPAIHAELCAQENENAKFIKNLPQLDVKKLLSPFRKGILESESTLAVRDAITNEVKMIPGHQLLDVTKGEGMSSSHTYETVSSRAADNDFILPRRNSFLKECITKKRNRLFASLIIIGSILLAVVLTVVLALTLSGDENGNGTSSTPVISNSSTTPHPTVENKSTPVTNTTTEPIQTTRQSGGGGLELKSSSTTATPHKSTSPIDSTILVIGGDGDNARSSMEFYRPFNPQLNHVINGAMRQGQYGHTSALMDDGTVITVGGWDADHGTLSSCSRFTPSTSRVTQCPSLNTPRERHGSSVLNGVLYVCGGWRGTNLLKSCERLLSNGWQDSVSMNNKRGALSMVSLNGYLYAIGGYANLTDQLILSSVERLGVTDSHWTNVQSMNNKRFAHSSVVMEGKIFVCGGADGRNYVSRCEQYNPVSDKWTYIAPMNRERLEFGLVSDGFNLFAVGGDDPNYRTVEMYDGKKRSWEMMQTELIYPQYQSSAVLIPT